jgi:hypothetical protein
MTKTVTLTDEQHERLMRILDQHKDTGGDFGGYQSDELQALIAALNEDLTDMVKVPTDEDGAVVMVLLGMDWLKENAPHRLRSQFGRAAEPEPSLEPDPPTMQLARPSPWIPTRK